MYGITHPNASRLWGLGVKGKLGTMIQGCIKKSVLREVCPKLC